MARFGEALLAATELAERWAMYDPDPVTRGQVDALVDAGDPQLIRLFEGRIAFGTAGLRAPVGPGPNNMNALVVRQTTAAVVDWLIESGVPVPKLLIGFDARHDSQAFAEHAAAATVASGGVALRADAAGPTPVFAHALLAESADAAVVITASHNPPADNGYKLYLGDGLQLVDPADAQIAERIDALADQWFERGTAIDDAFAALDRSDLKSVDEWTANHRRSAVAALFTSERDITIAYTAMHGVGGQPILDAFAAAGFPEPFVAAEQFEPDGDFPTVPFPNPEEPGALERVGLVAHDHRTDAAFANDPDADRLAIAVHGRGEELEYWPLSGNELGVLLADHVLRHTTGSDRVVARSVVSSRQLDAMAAAHGVHCEVTLTGFKWVARPIVSHAPARFVFGYEEAIGYCIGDHVRDKDGVTAALMAAEVLASLKAEGKTAYGRLDELAAEFGVHANQPISVRFDDDPSRVDALMERVAAAPPTTLGGSDVVECGPVGLGTLPPTAGLHMLTAENTQIIVRPSGTEPKIKAYIEAIVPVSHAGFDTVGLARTASDSRVRKVAQDVQALLAG